MAKKKKNDLSDPSKEFQSIVGRRIRERRDQLNWSQGKLKEKSGVSTAAISELENGKNSPSFYLMFLLSNAMGRSVSWFCEGA
jgi:transcriptional regulator with XRE-family HTH domain